MHIQPFDFSICENASLADLDIEKVAEFFKQDRVQVQADYHPGISDEDQLVQFGFLQSLHPTYGTLLCFGQNPPNWLTGAFTRCTIWRGNDRHSGWLDVQEYQAGLLRQFEASRDFLRKHMRLSHVINSEGSTQRWEIPLRALEEALANALVHREYVNRTNLLHVEVFDDRVEINSPGGPPSPLTLDLLGVENRSHLRNPQIARIFFLSGYIEGVGAGIQRMQRLLIEAGLHTPEFRLSAAKAFTVVLFRPKQVSDDFVSMAEA